MKPILATLLVCTLLAAGDRARAAGGVCTPSREAVSPGSAVDRAGIQAVLDTYVRSVSTGNRTLFESQLLDLAIPFFGIGGELPHAFIPELRSVQDYPGFRRSIFDSGRTFSQKFYDVVINQDGDLAQVSLKFKTLELGSDAGGCGWKILQLLRVGGHWKIASEFYTGYPFKAADW